MRHIDNAANDLVANTLVNRHALHWPYFFNTSNIGEGA
jgi:hypothetical protein